MLTIVTMKWDRQKTGESIPSQDIVTYGREHVVRHFNMCKKYITGTFKYVFYTDEMLDNLPEGIDQRPLFPMFEKHFARGGCYHRMFMFSKEFFELHGPFVSMDLDMVITDNITSLFDTTQPFIYYKMKNGNGHGWRMNNGMFYVNSPALDQLWQVFDSKPDECIANRKGPGTDQGLSNGMISNLNEMACWQQGMLGPGIYDLRQDFINEDRIALPKGCKIIMCPGPRDPSRTEDNSRYPWMKLYYLDMLDVSA